MSWGRSSEPVDQTVAPCPTDCGRRPHPTTILCDECWGLLTPQQQRRLYDAWEQARDGIDGGREYFAKVKAEAVEVVRVQRLRPPEVGAST